MKDGQAEMSAINSTNKLYRRRRLINRVMIVTSALAVGFGLFWLVWILSTLVVRGFEAIGPNMFMQMTPPPGSDGGLANAIVGSILMGGFGTLLGTPIGILAGTYLAEYGNRGWLAPTTRFINDILLSAPSIVIGLFIYSIFISQVKHFSAWGGVLALAIIVIPVVVVPLMTCLSLYPIVCVKRLRHLGHPGGRL
jgi:phosphate transport system permease protein